MCIKVIWINGAFGSGKTTVAFEMHNRLDNSVLYDPENIGYFLRKNMPKETPAKDDFQDEILWRTLNYEIIKNIASTYDGTILIPMTLYNPQYYQEIIGRLLEAHIPVEHYILGASKETIRKRLKKRMERGAWAKDKIDSCLQGFELLRGGKETTYIDTNNKKVEEIVKELADHSGIPLTEDKNLALTKKIRRLLTTIKHIR